MLSQSAATDISRVLTEICGEHYAITSASPVGGGCINRCYRVSGTTGQPEYFLKLNSIDKQDNLRNEYLGLLQLSAGPLRVPRPIAYGVTPSPDAPRTPGAAAAHAQAYLLLEYLPMVRPQGVQDWERMGRQLAGLHAVPVAKINAQLTHSNAPEQALLPEQGFGAVIQNATLGDRPGFVGTHPRWSDFFCQYRLEFQLRQAREIHGHTFQNADTFLGAAKKILDSRTPPPALCHGDLWGGNAAFAESPEDPDSPPVPVIFDPAPYVADPETDLAMTELFGGFPSDFYRGYRAAGGIDSGYVIRSTIYNLYHVINHYNLFGGGYRQQAQAMITEVIAASR